MANLIVLFSYFIFFFYIYRMFKTNSILLLLPIYYLFTVSYVLTGVFFLNYAKETPFDLYGRVSELYILKASLFYILASVSFYAGSSVFKDKHCVQLFFQSKIKIKHQKSLLILCVFAFFVFIFSYGVEPLIYRDGYISEYHDRNKTGLILFYFIAPIAFLFVPFVKGSIVNKVIYIFFFFILFSSSSRFLVMLPFLYIVGSYLRDGYFKFSIFFVNMVLIVLGLVFVLQIRYYPQQGLLPNIASLFSKGIDVDYLFIGLNYAFSFSLMGTAYVIEHLQFDLQGFLIGINPIPSRYLNISHMLDVQEMLPTAPISAISLLSQFGILAVLFFYLISGVVFSYVISRLKGKTILYYAVAGLFIIFMLLSIQYNIRGLTRFLYGSIFIFFMYFIFFKYRFTFRR
ncbi:hypothetical protein FKQ60_10135 [Vibrio sp. A11]|uniref:hypothetical protein n=1 Tax=Vibrio sp. A11 TaxID=2591464 RepID=UPI001482E3D5|nr:hypothetical protein [Vibrio sp. A11]NNN61208.1 hypothetical protein [Vibrio sp. A11]